MATGVAAAAEIAALGTAIEREFPSLPVTYQGAVLGGQRVCHLLLSGFAAAAPVRGWRLRVACYAIGVTQAEMLELAGLFVRYEGIILRSREVGIWNVGQGTDTWSVLYALVMLAQQVYPAGYREVPLDPAGDFDYDLFVNGHRA